MSDKCYVVPTVRNPKTGEEEVSQLFESLNRMYGNIKTAVAAYARVVAAFSKYDDISYSEDKNGEPELLSILGDQRIQKALGSSKSTILLNAENLAGFRTVDRKRIGYDTAEEALDKCYKYNKESKDNNSFVAVYEYNSGAKKYYPVLQFKTEKSELKAQKQLLNTSYKAEVDKLMNRYNCPSEVSRIFSYTLEKAGIDPDVTSHAILEGIKNIIHICKGDGIAVSIPTLFKNLIYNIIKNNSPNNFNRFYNIIKAHPEVIESMGFDPYDETTETVEKMANRVVQSLIERFIIKQEAIPEDFPYYQRVSLLMEETMRFFAQQDPEEISDALEAIARKTGNSVTDVFVDVDTVETNTVELSEERKAISASAKNTKKAFEQMINDDIRRLAVLKKQLKKDEEGRSFINFAERDRIQSLRDRIADEEYASGIAAIGYHAVTVMQKLQDAMDTLKNGVIKSKDSLKKQHRVLREMLINIQAYENMISHWNEDIFEYCTGEAEKNAVRQIKQMQDALDRTKEYFKKEHKRLTLESLESVYGKSITWEAGGKKGLEETIDTLMKVADKDISSIDLWMESMSESSDFILKAMDNILNKAKERARLKAVDGMHRIKNLGLRMEKDGIKTTDWMYEKDENGELTLNFITPLDWTRYKKDRHEFLLEMDRKYGKRPGPRDLKKKKKEIMQWNSEHLVTDSDGINKPNPDLYRNEAYYKLPKNKREYLDEMMILKQEADEFYGPGKTVASRIPIIHKTTLQRLKDAKDAQTAWSIISEGIKDKFIAREYEEGNELPEKEEDFYDETGMVKEETIETLQNFDGSMIYTVPTYYTRLPKGMDKSDISTDAITSMCLYYSKAAEFAETSDVVDEIEDDIHWINNEYGVKKVSNGSIIRNVANVLGERVEGDSITPGKETRIAQKAQHWKEMQIYGMTEKDEGKLGKASIAKTTDTLNAYTSLHTLSLNLVSGLSNLSTGACQITAEAVGGEFFGFKDLFWAGEEFFKYLPSAMGNIGKRFKDDKLSLFLEKFNVLQDFEKEMRETNFAAKTRVGKMGLGSMLFMFNSLGEFYMQTQAALAIAHRMILTDADGKKMNLWDAIEVKYYTEVPGVFSRENKGLGAEIEIKPGLKKADGTEFTQEDMIAYVNKSKAVNQRMHGIYNKYDKSMMQQYALGRAAILFRKWIVPSFERRFSKTAYNANLGTQTEGYYRTAWRIAGRVIKELKAGQFAMSTLNLSPMEKANLKKAAMEYATFIMIAILANGIEWPEDKDKPYAMALMELNARRQYRELGALVPSHVILEEMYSTIKSPTADLNVIQKFLNLLKVVTNPGDWDEEIENGVNKGRTKNVQRMIDVLPVIKPVLTSLNPVEKLDAYRNSSLL